jgi:tRNA modification GTPase
MEDGAMVDAPLFDDTIAALATPPGRGALAVVRVSGNDALPLVGKLTDGAVLTMEPRQTRLLALRDPRTGDLIDRAVVTVFRAPGSYTGEDLVELSTHGGVLVPQLVLSALHEAGARVAEPGEFTRRAYLAGKLDLLQAEAVLDLIEGRTPALHRAAIHHLERGLSARVDALREALLGTEALLVYSIDFPDEDEQTVDPERLRGAAADVRRRLAELLDTAPEGELLREGALVVLAGRPNSGKSSLFNALLGLERAIVTEVPGTTRDALEGDLLVDGYPLRLVDTAGLREVEDIVETLGIEVARRYLHAAQLVILCVEAGRAGGEAERELVREVAADRVLMVRTKGDLEPSAGRGGEELWVSVVTGEGLPELRQRLLQRAFGGLLAAGTDMPLVTRARHRRALERALEEIDQFLDALRQEVPAELAATHLRAAAHALESLVGAVTPDEVLGQVFASFCVGK